MTVIGHTRYKFGVGKMDFAGMKLSDYI